MTPRKLSFALVIVVSIVAALLAACGGGGDNSTSARTGALTDPRNVPTATTWPQPPDVIILDPNAITPLSGGGGTDNGNGTGATPEPGTCGKTYTIVSGDNLSDIAGKCGVSLQNLLDANPGIEPTTLRIGQVINIPQ